MLVVPVAVAPLVAASAVMFLTALGVPLSWRKLDIGTEFVLIGWKFNLSVNHAYLPADKAAKAQVLLHQLHVRGAKVPRKEIEKVIGLLIWFTAGAFWLLPWLSSFYKLLCKPAAVPLLLTIDQFQDLVVLLDSNSAVSQALPQCDIRAHWKLHSVSNSPICNLSAPSLLAPRLQHGRVSCAFYDFES